MSARAPSGRSVTIERTFDAPIAEVWELWTTKEGIGSWWGPDGFAVTVRALDLRPGGELVYAMSAVAPEQRRYLRDAGMPETQVVHARITECVPPRRLVLMQRVDFIPGVEAYEVSNVVELFTVPGGTLLVLTLEAMHEESWTSMAVAGWEMELAKLARVIEARRAG